MFFTYSATIAHCTITQFIILTYLLFAGALFYWRRNDYVINIFKTSFVIRYRLVLDWYHVTYKYVDLISLC